MCLPQILLALMLCLILLGLTGSITCRDAAAMTGRAMAPQDGEARPKQEFRTLPVPLSGNSSATPTSGNTPDTQITTGATAAPMADEPAPGFRRSPSPTTHAIAAPAPSGAVAGLAHLSPGEPGPSASQRMLSNQSAQPQQQQPGPCPPTLTQTSARHAHELQEAAQQRVLAFVQSQAHARAHDAAVGLDMLSLTTPTSGELVIDGHLAPPAQPLQRTLTHPTHSQLSHSGRFTGSGEVPVLADGRAKTTSGHLGVPVSQLLNGTANGAVRGRDVNPKFSAAASGSMGGAMPMQDIDGDPFADVWQQLGEGARNQGERVTSAAHNCPAGMLQMPDTCDGDRVEPLRRAPSSSPPGRRLRHVMEEGVRTASEGGRQEMALAAAHTAAQDPDTATALLTALQSESQKYVVQKVFSEADLDDCRPGSVRARKKRISPGPGRRNFGGLPDMPGPSTALPFLPDITDNRAVPRSADAILGKHTGTALASPPPPAGHVATAADRGASLPPQQYDTQLRQFVHPGVMGDQDTFVRVAHSSGAHHFSDTDVQRASSSPFHTGGLHSQPNARNFWKVPGKGPAGVGGQAEDGEALAGLSLIHI